jgi:hypothetical protein
LVAGVAIMGLLPWLVVASAGAARADALNRCVSSDHGLPEVTALSFTPSSADVRERAAQVEVSVRATDTGGPGPASGVQAVSVQLYAPAGGPLLGTDTVGLLLDSDGTWRGSLTIPRGVEPGQWRPTVLVRDNVGGVRLLDPEALAEAGLSTGIDVVSAPDRDTPVLTGLHLSGSRVDTTNRPRRVAVTAHLSDATTTVVRAFVLAQGARITREARLHPVAGTTDDWAGTLVIPRWAGRRTTLQLSAFSVDEAGNRTWSTSGALRAAGQPWRIRVRSRADHAGPTATVLRLRPAAVDVRSGPRRVRLVVRVRDDRSGVAAVAPTLQLRDGPALDIPVRRVTGTRRDGVWRGSVVVPSCAVSGAWSLWLRTRDRSGLVSSHVTHDAVRVRAGDHVAPRAERVADDGGQPAFRFTEDVVGISTRAAYLVTSGLAHTRLEGTWNCRNRHGAAVDCAAGPVRLATYRVTEGAPTGPVDLVLNPEHVLDVLDLAGNPAYGTMASG